MKQFIGIASVALVLLIGVSIPSLPQSQIHTANCIGSACSTGFLTAGATNCLDTSVAGKVDINTGCVARLDIANDFLGQPTWEAGNQVLKEIAAPSNPASTYLKPYAGTDHNLHILSSAGVDTILGPPTSSLIDYQKQTSAIVGDTTDKTIYTTTIAASTIPVGKCIRIRWGQKHTTGSGSLTDKLFFGATSVTALSANADTTEEILEANVCNDPGSSVIQNIITPGFQFSGGSSIVAWSGGQYTAAAENTTGSIILKATFNGAGTEQMTGRFWMVEVLR